MKPAFPAAVTFKLCGTNVCSIELVHQPSAEWLGIIAELQKRSRGQRRESQREAQCAQRAT